MRIHLCGVRGSTPAPGAEFVRYGGHTACVAVVPDGGAVPTLVAVTRCRVASVPAVQLDLSDLAELATGHRREEGVRG